MKPGPALGGEKGDEVRGGRERDGGRPEELFQNTQGRAGCGGQDPPSLPRGGDVAQSTWGESSQKQGRDLGKQEPREKRG